MEEKVIITAKDHLVTNEQFNIVTTNIDGLLKTSPTPTKEKIGNYYQSENYISHTDAKKTLVDNIYQIVKSYSLNKKYKLLKKLNPEAKTLLDIGSGTGDFISYCKKGFDCYGTEPSEVAREKSISKGNKVVVSTEELEIKKFDIITMWHVLEHVHDLELQIKKLNELLNKNGAIIIAVPNYKSEDAKHYKEHWAAYDVPRHIWHFDKHSFKELFKKENLFVVKILPMIFDSFYVSLLSEKIKTGRNNFVKAFKNGLQSNLKAKSTGEYSSLIYIIEKRDKDSF
ncbi:class I SAM-dependent methyltransferase [Joostella sp. CR20]|uniref:class I SAM-dependent methyltransferase n=1 Tax=Joostella sp. CR20 TaxID=2804312 RepID=UPI00313E10B4